MDYEKIATTLEERQEAIVQSLYQKSLKLYAPVYKNWLATIKKSVRESGSPEAFLKVSPKILKTEGFAGLIQKVSYLGNLIGQSGVRDEVEAIDRLVRKDAVDPKEYLDLPFSEAIEWFKEKQVVPNANYASLIEGYHAWAFSVAGETRKALLDEIKELLGMALEEGQSLEEFEQGLEKSVKDRGWGPVAGSRRSYIIFDTNIRGAIGSGRGRQMKALAEENPGANYVVAWRWRDSPEPRKHHQRLHNKAIPFEHPFWKECRTPAGFGCRCAAYLMRPTIAQRLGIEVLKPSEVPNPKTIADPGFRYPLWGEGEEAKKAYLESQK